MTSHPPTLPLPARCLPLDAPAATISLDIMAFLNRGYEIFLERRLGPLSIKVLEVSVRAEC